MLISILFIFVARGGFDSPLKVLFYQRVKIYYSFMNNSNWSVQGEAFELILDFTASWFLRERSEKQSHYLENQGHLYFIFKGKINLI